MEKERRVIVNVSMPLSLLERVEKYAKEVSMPRSRAISFLLDKALKEVEKVSKYGGVETNVSTTTSHTTIKSTSQHTPSVSGVETRVLDYIEELREKVDKGTVSLNQLGRALKELDPASLSLEELARARGIAWEFGMLEIAKRFNDEIKRRRESS